MDLCVLTCANTYQNEDNPINMLLGCCNNNNNMHLEHSAINTNVCVNNINVAI